LKELERFTVCEIHKAYFAPDFAQPVAELLLFTPMSTFSDAPSDEYMRRALLLHLERIKSKESRTVDPLTIAFLRDQYNMVMERIHDRGSRSCIDFITRLPPELSLYCLRESLPARHYAGRLLDLTMVSTQWGDFIISAKELWAYVDVKASQHDAIATLATFLELSGHRLLHLTIWNDPGDEWDKFKPLLMSHQQRFSTIHFKQESGLSGSRRFSIACRVLQSFKSLNRSINVHLGDQPSLSLHLSQLERLLQSSDHYVLQGLDFPLSILSKSHKIIHQIGSVTTGQTLDHMGSILPSMTKLTSIWLRPDECSQETSPEIGSVTSGQVVANVGPTLASTGNLTGVWLPLGALSEHKNQRVVPLSPVEIARNPIRLTSLTSFQAFNHSLSSLASSVVMTLSDLTVAISRHQWMSLLACLRLATNLKKLSLDLRRPVSGDADEEMVDLTSLTPILGLTVLSLQVQGSEESPEGTSSATTLFGTVIDAFVVIYPGVLSLTMEHCNLGINHAILREYLGSLKSLEYLGVWEVGVGQSLEIAPILLPSLKRLDCDGVLVPYINAPALESVRMAGEEGLLTERFSSLLAAHIWNVSKEFGKTLCSLSDENYSSLQSIAMDLSTFSGWNMPSLPSLRRIRITSSKHFDQSATMLCVSILYHPHHCPVLEEIEVSGFVEWDILMLMLERRNFRNENIKRISTLRIPLTPPRLGVHLESLLRGVYTERPSNADLSTEAIAEVLCDAET
jgi:hypothetical protein